MKHKNKGLALVLSGALALSLLTGCSGTASENDAAAADADALVIADQGIFSAGGTVTQSDGTFDVANYYTSRAGSTSHVDHANVLYQIPEDASELPMVFLHGYGPIPHGLDDHAGRSRGLVRPVSAHGPQRVADRPAAPRRGRTDLGRRHNDHRTVRPDLVHPVPHRHLSG